MIHIYIYAGGILRSFHFFGVSIAANKFYLQTIFFKEKFQNKYQLFELI